jgi:hypothetical protein
MNRVDVYAYAARLPGWGLFQHAVQEKRYRRWLRNGRPSPSPSRAKQLVLRQLALDHQLPILVETGTFTGDMLYALRNDFRRLYSIELSKSLHAHAECRFRRQKHIKLIYGDSRDQLRLLLPDLTEPTLFWLDGHYSGKGTAHGVEATPIMTELQALTGIGQRAVVAIDDARCFGNDPAYPKQSDLCDFLHSRFPGLQVEERHDILILTGFNPLNHK